MGTEIGRDDCVPWHDCAGNVYHIGWVQFSGHLASVIKRGQQVAMGGDTGFLPAVSFADTISQMIQRGGDIAHQLNIGAVNLVGVWCRIDMNDGGRRGPRLDKLNSVEPGGDDQVRAGQEIPYELVAGHFQRPGVSNRGDLPRSRPSPLARQ